MTDDLSTYGLGALPDAPDERDYPLSALYASEGLTASVSLPASYAARGMPPVLNQRATPMCVAYSSSAMKSWQDKRDQERFFDFDEPRFFSEIGGTANGAYVRAAMERLRLYGYPVVGIRDPGDHRIAAYYAVSRDLSTIKAAIFDLGPVVVSTPWYRSWFRPAAGVLPRPDTQVGGHAIVAYGWDARASASATHGAAPGGSAVTAGCRSTSSRTWAAPGRRSTRSSTRSRTRTPSASWRGPASTSARRPRRRPPRSPRSPAGARCRRSASRSTAAGTR